MHRDVILRHRAQNLVKARLANVHQHISTVLTDDGGLLLHRSAWKAVWCPELAAKVLFQDLPHRRLGHLVVIVLVEPPFFSRLEEGVVVTSIKVTTVDKDTMQLILPGLGGVAAFNKEGCCVEGVGEFITVVDLHHHVSLNIVLESLQLQVKYVGETGEDNALVRILELVFVTREVLVLAVHLLNLYVILEALEEILVAAHVELDIPEVLDAARFVVDIDAGDVRLDLATEHLRKYILRLRALHFFLHTLHQLTRELLYVLLLKDVASLPPE